MSQNRKVMLKSANIYQSDVARATDTSQALVSRVLSGQRWMGEDARRVMDFIAFSLNTDVASLFPESTRQKGWQRPESIPNP